MALKRIICFKPFKISKVNILKNKAVDFTAYYSNSGTIYINYVQNNTEPVSFEIFDLQGVKYGFISNGNKSTGTYNCNFNATSLAKGIYLVQMKSGIYRETKKVVVQ